MTCKQHLTASGLQALVLAVLVAGVLVLAGCSAAKQVVDPKQQRREMMESAAKFYVADAAQDLKGLKALVHDPENIWGLATATVPPADVPTSAVRWKWRGDVIEMNAESDETTYTLSSTEASPGVVVLKAGAGETLDSLTLTMLDGAWRIDVPAIQKAVEKQANSPEGQKQKCWQNQMEIENAIASYDSDKGKLPKKMADLIPNHLDAALACPTTGEPYTFDVSGLVLPCKVHGHYPEEEL